MLLSLNACLVERFIEDLKSVNIKNKYSQEQLRAAQIHWKQIDTFSYSNIATIIKNNCSQEHLTAAQKHWKQTITCIYSKIRIVINNLLTPPCAFFYFCRIVKILTTSFNHFLF